MRAINTRPPPAQGCDLTQRLSPLPRYIPALDERVIGLVVSTHSENFVVDVRGPFTATLPVLAFEGATRRNRPNIKVGTVVLVAMCNLKACRLVGFVLLCAIGHCVHLFLDCPHRLATLCTHESTVPTATWTPA